MRRLRSEPLIFFLVLVAALLIFLHQLNLLKPFEIADLIGNTRGLLQKAAAASA